MAKRICLDAGHGGKDPGCVKNGLQEKKLTLTLAKYVQDYLQDHYTGHSVKLTRTTDVFVELSERANIANRFDADVFLSCHVNAGGGTGFESFIYTNVGKATIAMQNLVNAEALRIAKRFGLGAHGNDKKRGDLAVVRETKMPAILTEICFIDSKDASLLKKDNFLRDMAAAYAIGIAKFVGLPAKKQTSAKPVAKPAAKTIHRVQVGAFSDPKNAAKLVAELKKKGYDAFITK